MNFIRRLKKELPLWIEKGWVNEGCDREILAHLEHGEGRETYLSFALSILGVLLLGSGVVTWFAANWRLIPKFWKLLLLLSAMWGAYGGAGFLLREDRSPRIGQALLLLGVLLFGANIMLIAQMYHIDSHAPNGVLLWALGALSTAYLFRSSPCLVAAIVLGALWTGMEAEAVRYGVHWAYLLFWFASLPLLCLTGGRPALHASFWALFVWTLGLYIREDLFLYGSERGYPYYFYLTHIVGFAWFALFLSGRTLNRYAGIRFIAQTLREYSLLAVLCCIYALSVPSFYGGVVDWKRGAVFAGAGSTWVFMAGLCTAAVLGLELFHRFKRGAPAPAGSFLPDWLIAGGFIGLVWANFLCRPRFFGSMAVAVNLLYFCALVRLIVVGLRDHDRSIVNLAFVFFGLTLLSRYFDTFWTLLGRSWFFMGGGVLLVGGGILMERHRRKLNAMITVRTGGEVEP